MPHIKIDGSDNRVLVAVSERMGLGPNGPKVIVNAAMMLVMIVVVLIWAVGFWQSGNATGPAAFAPLIVIAFIASIVIRSVRGAKRTVDDGWRG